jgi:tyrosinase
MPDDAVVETPQKPSRYQRFQEILDKAQGTANPNYQGYGRFWRLPLAELLGVTLYGVRMIAPASAGAASPATSASPSGSCCCGPGGGEAAAPARQPGRGDASGLVQGLRGLYPFDGTQFARLPWGGSPVPESDIQFIASWIDDGCPAEDAEPDATIQVTESSRLRRANGDEDHPRLDAPGNAYRDQSGSIKVRKNIDFLMPEELERYRNAILAMHAYDAYYQDERSFDYWARIHANSCQHGWEEFLTWHRLYLHFFEQQLQDIDPSVTVPYWDWTSTDQDWTTMAVDTGTVPEAFRCWVDQAALSRLKDQIPASSWQALAGIKDQKFNSGPRLLTAAGISYTADPAATQAILAELQKVNPLWHRLRWPGGNSSLIFEAYPRPEDIDRIVQIANFFTFGSGPSNDHFFGALEDIHNLMHNFSGGMNPNFPGTNPQSRTEPQYGDMQAPGTTAFDPIFWSHHSNVDRVWAEWQTLHPGAGPDNPDAILPPWTMTVGQVANVRNLGYEYLKSEHLYPTDNQVPITRFKSAKANVHPAVLADHRQAEVRLHKVQFSVHGGGFIRVFLNVPDADASTPTRNNPNYVGQISLFSGGCVGGPGHCDPPPQERRPWDHRPRHHKTPGNHRLDATEAVQRLTAEGETDLHVNLVVLDLDGKPKSNALFLDAVSLVFKD